ncbi:unnamed protein product [Microthlaspi erraticum]|uniref:Uncharacterized protein n=1 Tax=Microthlaspi erraticum TaxID=1685480 RepID=A0A6D2K4M3_9BRAS|nr:unnamed protein product [Microthlaspi erraticum]CAA7043034.1 unnamed protein product [Microthlaspi erraticum]
MSSIAFSLPRISINTQIFAKQKLCAPEILDEEVSYKDENQIPETESINLRSEILGAAMADVNPADLVDGNVVNFREKDTRHRYEGKVCYFELEASRFGIQDVTMIVEGESLYLGGAYINTLPFIEDLVVLQVAEPHSDSEDEQQIGDNPGGVNEAAGNNEAGQNGANGTSGHASVNQAAGASSNNTQASLT